MRKVTKESVRAFLQHKNGKFGGVSNYNGRQNTEVKDEVLYLFGNAIAKWENDQIFFRMAGWTSPTTTERLSGLGLPISIRKGTASIRGQEIDTYTWYPLNKFVVV
jgi:hypothetical protein